MWCRSGTHNTHDAMHWSVWYATNDERVLHHDISAAKDRQCGLILVWCALCLLLSSIVKHARLLRISRNENERNENNHINRHPPHRITISILLLCRFDKLFLVLYLARCARNERILCHNLFGIVERSPHGRRGTDWLAHTAYCISHATVLFVYHFLLLFNSVDCGMNK